MRSRLRYRGCWRSSSAEIEIFESNRSSPCRHSRLEIFLSLSKWRWFLSPPEKPSRNYNRSEEGSRVHAMRVIYWGLWGPWFTVDPGETSITPLELNATFNADSKLGALVPP